MQLDGRWVLVARTGVYWLGRYCSPHWGVCHLCCPLTPRPRRAPSPSIIGSSRLALPSLFRPRRPLGVDPSSNLSRLLHPQRPQTSTVRGSQLNSHCGLRAHSPNRPQMIVIVVQNNMRAVYMSTTLAVRPSPRSTMRSTAQLPSPAQLPVVQTSCTRDTTPPRARSPSTPA